MNYIHLQGPNCKSAPVCSSCKGHQWSVHCKTRILQLRRQTSVGSSGLCESAKRSSIEASETTRPSALAVYSKREPIFLCSCAKELVYSCMDLAKSLRCHASHDTHEARASSEAVIFREDQSFEGWLAACRIQSNPLNPLPSGSMPAEPSTCIIYCKIYMCVITCIINIYIYIIHMLDRKYFLLHPFAEYFG